MPSRQPLAVDTDLELRRARPDDVTALRRLADLDSQPPPRADAAYLLAIAHGEPIAALALDGSWSAADPFCRSAAALDLLQARRVQLCGRATHRGRLTLVKRVRSAIFAG